MSIEKLQNSLEHLEQGTLNNIRAPVASTVSGGVRAVIGVVQVVFGAIAGLYGLMSGDSETRYYGTHHFVHGVLNLGRALIEIIPFVNLLMTAYDSNKDWSKYDSSNRFNYVTYSDRFNYVTSDDRPA